jgi:hypothetical protein
MKTNRKKFFDCVEMKRRGAEAVHKQLRGRDNEQQIAYWRARTAELRKRLAGSKNRPGRA